MRTRFQKLRTLTAAVATALCVGGTVGFAQGPTPPDVIKAQTALRAGHADSAITMLEKFFAQNPTATVGRIMLGNAYRQNSEPDKALRTYLAITQPRPLRLQAMYAAAGLHAVRNSADSAIRLLNDLKTTGAFDMSLALTSDDFATLRRDPRFAATMFQPSDFTNPFVEPVKVLHEWRGEAAGDQFSWIARGIGDVDGDHVRDVVTSAPSFGANGQFVGPGKVYLYSGRTGALLWVRTGDSTESLGTGLEGAGDLNGDGFADVIVGAPNANSNGQAAGRASVFSGRTGERLFVIDGDKANDALGSIVAGQKDGTQTPLLVGAPGAGPAGRGQVRVYDDTSRALKFVIDADSTGAALGAMFTSLVGDVNGDRVPDVYAADFSDGTNGAQTGRVYVHSGVDGKRLYRFTGEHANDGFGIGSADIGDVNQDGFDDLLVGAWQYSRAAQSGGRVYLYSGRDGTILRTITGRVAGETLGFDATGIGDVNGDGIIDLLVASSWSNINGFRSGRMYIISGR